MSERIDIAVPDIGDFKDVEIIEIHVVAGDQVAAEDPLITLESDKAAMDVPAPASGTIESLDVELGGHVSEGDVIGRLSLNASDTAAGSEQKTESKPVPDSTPPDPVVEQKPPQPDESAASASPAATTATAPMSAAAIDPVKHVKAHASPAVRRYARELGADLSQIQGSGNKGRILKDDVTAFVKSALSGAASSSAPAGQAVLPTVPAPDFSKFGEVESVALSRIKKISGKHLHACWLNVPHVTQFDEVDITELEAFRNEHKAAAKAQGFGLTPLPFVMKAAVAALKAFPSVNSSLDPSGENLIVKRYYHIGIAVDTRNGLVVPVVRDVDQKGVMQLAQELGEIGAKARDGKLGPADMQGASFSITSLGGIGGSAFTPIVNAPEVAILGLSKAQMKPVWNGSDFEPRLILPLSMSYDHRVVDGAEGVRFTTYLGQQLSDMRRMLL